MKILQINTLSKLKSTGRTTFEMHEWFLKNGYQSKVVTSVLSRNEVNYGQIIIGNKIEMKIHAFLSRLTGLQGYFSRINTIKLLRYLKAYNPDVVILRVLHSNFLDVISLLKYLKKEGYVTLVVLHDFWWVTGHCVYPVKSRCEQYLTGCQTCPQIRKDNPSWLFDTSEKLWMDKCKIYNGWDNLCFVGVSKWTIESIYASEMCKAIEKEYVYNWIDGNVFFDKNIQNDCFTILAVSTVWTKEKGIDDLLCLSNLLRDEKLVIVGHIASEYKNKFEYGNISFIDYTDSINELNDLYNEADVYLSLSVFETFGKTIAEAISCGTPCVVYNNTACPELVSGGCGYVVENHNVKDIYKYINKIRENGKNNYKEACKRKSENMFSLDKSMHKYIAIMEKLINKS